MPKLFNTGSKREVLINMSECAIRDRRGFIEAMSPVLEFEPDDEETNRVINEAKEEIEDFRRLAKNFY